MIKIKLLALALFSVCGMAEDHAKIPHPEPEKRQRSGDMEIFATNELFGLEINQGITTKLHHNFQMGLIRMAFKEEVEHEGVTETFIAPRVGYSYNKRLPSLTAISTHLNVGPAIDRHNNIRGFAADIMGKIGTRNWEASTDFRFIRHGAETIISGESAIEVLRRIPLVKGLWAGGEVDTLHFKGKFTAPFGPSITFQHHMWHEHLDFHAGAGYLFNPMGNKNEIKAHVGIACRF